MSAFVLKIIALTAMFFDHAGILIPEKFGLPDETNIFNVIGRVAFPIFVYLIAEGFRQTKNPEKYLVRLFAFALISEIPFDLAFNDAIDFANDTNIFYTLFFGGLAIYFFKTLHKVFFIGACFPALVFMILAEYLSSDYGAYGVAFIFIMYVISSFKLRLAAMAVLCVFQHTELIWMMILFVNRNGFLPSDVYFLMIAATFIPVLLIAFYNGKRGADLKWFFYIAYPAHIAILTLLGGFT